MQFNWFDVSVSDSVGALFEALHLVHGNLDDSAYEKNVCSYYKNKIENLLDAIGLTSLEGIEISFVIDSIDDAEAVINNLDEFTDFLVDLNDSIGKKVDLSQFDVFLPSKIDLLSTEFEEWIKTARNRLSLLPAGECYVSEAIRNNVLNILLDKNVTYYDVSREDIHELDKYFFLTDNCKYSFSPESLISKNTNTIRHDSIKEFNRITNNPLVKFFISENANTSSDNITEESWGIGRQIAFQYASDYENIIVSVDTVISEMLKAISNEYGRLGIKVRSRKKPFIIGGLSYLAILSVAITLVLVFKPNPFINYLFDTFGVWSNIWKCVLTCLGSIGVFALCATPFWFEGVLHAICRFPFIPKGLITFVLIYLVYIVDLPPIFATNLVIPYRIVGTLFIISSVGIGLMDVFVDSKNNPIAPNLLSTKELNDMSRIKDELFDAALDSNNEDSKKISKDMGYWPKYFIYYIKSANGGRIFYSNILILIPLGLFFLFTWFFTYLAVGAIWVVTVVLIILLLISFIALGSLYVNGEHY